MLYKVYKTRIQSDVTQKMTTLGICSVHLAFMGSFVTHLVCIHQALIVGKG